MERKKMTGSGPKRPRQIEEEDELFSGAPKSFQENPEYQQEIISKSKPSTFTIRDIDPKLIDKIKNLAYTRKLKGAFLTNQSTITIEAITYFFENLKEEIQERPDAIKEVERKRGKRK